MDDLFDKKAIPLHREGVEKDPFNPLNPPNFGSPMKSSFTFPADLKFTFDSTKDEIQPRKYPSWNEVRLDKRIEPLIQVLGDCPHNYMPSQDSTHEVLSHLAHPNWFEGHTNKAKLEIGKFSRSLIADPTRPGNVLLFRGSASAHLHTGVYSTFFLKFGAEGLLEKIDSEEKLSHELEEHSNSSCYPLDPFVSVANEPMTACKFGVGSYNCVMVISVPIERVVIGSWNGADREYESYVVGGFAPWEIVGTIKPHELEAHGLPKNDYYYTVPEITEILNTLLPSWQHCVQAEQPGYINPSEINNLIQRQRDLWAKSSPLFGGNFSIDAPISELEREFLNDFTDRWKPSELPAAKVNFERCVITFVAGDPRTHRSMSTAHAGYFVELKSL